MNRWTLEEGVMRPDFGKDHLFSTYCVPDTMLKLNLKGCFLTSPRHRAVRSFAWHHTAHKEQRLGAAGRNGSCGTVTVGHCKAPEGAFSCGPGAEMEGWNGRKCCWDSRCCRGGEVGPVSRKWPPLSLKASKQDGKVKFFITFILSE